MLKSLEALEEIKNVRLIDHVKIKEGLFSKKLLNYERRYGKNVFSKQIPIIEKDLKALEIIKEKEVDIKAINDLQDLEDYNYYCSPELTQEEYNLLKGIL